MSRTFEEINTTIQKIYQTNGRLLSYASKRIIQESDFYEATKEMGRIYDPTLSFKNNAFPSVVRSLNEVKYKGIPIVCFLINVKTHLVINNNTKDTYVLDTYDKEFIRDLFLSSLSSSNVYDEGTKQVRFFFLNFFILYLLNFQWANIYLYIDKEWHGEFYIQLLDFLQAKIIDKFQGGGFKDLGNQFHTYYSNYLYWDIIEFKYKKYNTFFENIELYKFMHILYKNNKEMSFVEFSKSITEKVTNSKNSTIHQKFTTQSYLQEIYEIYLTPFGNPTFSINEKIEFNSDNSQENQSYQIDDDTDLVRLNYYLYIVCIIKSFWVQTNDLLLKILFIVFFEKSVNSKLSMMKYKEFFNLIRSFQWKKDNQDFFEKYFLTLYNLNVFTRKK